MPSTRKEKQNEEAQGGANPDRRVKPECTAEKKFLRRRLACGVRDDEAGNDKEYFNAHPAEPREWRGVRKLNVGGEVMLKTLRSVDCRPGPGPEHQVKNRDAESGPEAQRIQQ